MALGKIGDETALHPLMEALKDEEEYVKDAAYEALEEIRERIGRREFEVQRSKFKV